MNTHSILKNGVLFAQAYGTESYGTEVYSDCTQTAEGCVANTSTATAPNTGFLGLSQDAAIASLTGALLIAVAIAGAAYVLVSRRRRAQKKNEG